ncbi:hypothetical protein [Yinghuangia seranimata]|uniref:hypothetical protein n=1 Tax=Yinghuangia seranimata TaxID=408067 RepID=UPI00248B7292|nr:hypothetical protein [Yinghuangia seranimata]MDI2125043.1 hypothetical protein [Yinghuangia seranimata]
MRKNSARTLGLVAAGAFLLVGAASGAAVAAPADPSGTVHIDGFEPTSVVTDGSCKGWMNTEKQHGKWYAQGLVQSWRGQTCDMILERYHKGDGGWTIVSGRHTVTNTSDYTTWYYDDAGYKSRVCIWNDSVSQTWKCGGAV